MIWNTIHVIIVQWLEHWSTKSCLHKSFIYVDFPNPTIPQIFNPFSQKLNGLSLLKSCYSYGRQIFMDSIQRDNHHCMGSITRHDHHEGYRIGLDVNSIDLQIEIFFLGKDKRKEFRRTIDYFNKIIWVLLTCQGCLI